MAMKGVNRTVFKAQLMTMTVLLIFILVFAVMFIFAVINIQYNQIAARIGPASASVTLAGVLRQSSFAFANASAQTAATAISYYAYNTSLSGTNTLFNINLGGYIASLITNGTISGYGQYAYIANYGGSNVIIVNTATGTVVGSIVGGSTPIGVAFAPSGAYAYIINHVASNVVVVNTATGTGVGSITDTAPNPYLDAFAPSGSYAYVTNYGSSNVAIINTATSTVAGAITNGINAPVGVAFAPSGTYAYVSNLGSGNVVIVNTATNGVVGSIGVGGVYGIAFAPSGAYAYMAEYGASNVVIVNTSTKTITGSFTAGLNGPVGIAFAPSGAYAYITNYGSSNVVIVNTSSSSVVGSIAWAGFNRPYGMAFAPFGTGTAASDYFSKAMGSLNFQKYNSLLLSNFSNTGLVSVNETNLKVAQQGPFRFSVSYLENVAINQTYGVSNYVIPVNVTVGGLVYYVPITLTNSQSTGTGSNFQQMITANALSYAPYIAANWSNVEFSTGSGGSGNVLQAWIESGALTTSTNTVVWVNLPGGIPASSSITIFMNFMPYSVMSNGGPMGEAPQLSLIYGQNDNGAKVFNFYDDFKGGILRSTWAASSGASYTVNNGLAISAGALYSNSPLFYSVGNVLEAYQSASSSSIVVSGLSQANAQGLMSSNGGDNNVVLSLFETSYVGEWANDNGGTAYNLWNAYNIGSFTSNQYYIVGSAMSSTTIYAYLNYNTASVSGTYGNSEYAYLGLYQGSLSGSTTFGATLNTEWVRTRILPPGGVMPVQTTGRFV